MVRAAFFSMGLYLALCGAGLFFVDEVTLTERLSRQQSGLLDFATTWTDTGQRRMDPPDWLPFSCIGLGGVTMLYAIALPRT